MKTILACLSDEKDAQDILRIALPIAERHGSHLIGAHVQEHVAFYPGVAVHVPAEIYVDFQERQAADTEAVKAIFDDLTRTAACPKEWRLIKAGSPDTATALLKAAYTADLVILSQSEYSGDQSSTHYVQENVIRGCGRPSTLLGLGGLCAIWPASLGRAHTRDSLTPRQPMEVTSLGKAQASAEAPQGRRTTTEVRQGRALKQR